jgi:hypothetical protein
MYNGYSIQFTDLEPHTISTEDKGLRGVVETIELCCFPALDETGRPTGFLWLPSADFANEILY